MADSYPAMMNVEVTVRGLVSPRFGSEQISLLMHALHRAQQGSAYNPLSAGEPLLRDSPMVADFA